MRVKSLCIFITVLMFKEFFEKVWLQCSSIRCPLVSYIIIKLLTRLRCFAKAVQKAFFFGNISGTNNQKFLKFCVFMQSSVYLCVCFWFEKRAVLDPFGPKKRKRVNSKAINSSLRIPISVQNGRFFIYNRFPLFLFSLSLCISVQN